MDDRKKRFDPATLATDIQVALDRGEGRAALQRLASVVDVGPAGETADRVRTLCERLEASPELAKDLGCALRELLVELRVGPALTESGITPSTGFFTELGNRLARRILPETDDPGDLRSSLRTFFPGPKSHKRVAAVPDATWIRLLDALGIRDASVSGVDPEVASAIRALAHHIGSLGLQPEFTRRLPHVEDPDSPFLMLTDHVLAYIRSYTNEVVGDEPDLLQEALETIERGRSEVRHLRATKGQHGTSLQLTGITFRLLQLLDRLERLLRLTDPGENGAREGAVTLFKEILTAEETRNDVLPHVRARADLLAFQVVEHAARKGDKYITSSRREYGAFFLASLGGGAIVAVFSFLKVMMAGWSLPLGVEAVLYGINYSVCFVLIYLSGAALATKQPALTANTIAQALGNRQERHLDQLEDLVERVWRSQFVSFVGNLAMALPVAFLISEMFFRASGKTIAGPEKAVDMLGALNLWESGSIVFAAVAGVFLFMSGLISGWVDNRILYSDVPDRVVAHPLLQRVLGPTRTERFADFVDRKLGALTGNVFLGFALGSTGTIGVILGLPLDIRHIAFASAEFGTALEVLHFDVALAALVPVALGVVTIGLVNFLVSFGLSLVMALESRSITWQETRTLGAHLVSRFTKRPLDWFFPPADS